MKYNNTEKKYGVFKYKLAYGIFDKLFVIMFISFNKKSSTQLRYTAIGKITYETKIIAKPKITTIPIIGATKTLAIRKYTEKLLKFNKIIGNTNSCAAKETITVFIKNSFIIINFSKITSFKLISLAFSLLSILALLSLALFSNSNVFIAFSFRILYSPITFIPKTIPIVPK